MGQVAGVHESTVCRIVHKVEKPLARCPEFHLAGKKRLRGTGYEVIVIDVTEVEIEQPKETAGLLPEVSHPKSTGDS
ncbi:MAG: transposase family protein [Synechococcaceae cyanobacterium SM2_3_2]|nr:transposase family protein [Synechococcaceae cyanobacterium SM2_3_2]